MFLLFRGFCFNMTATMNLLNLRSLNFSVDVIRVQN